MLSNSIVEMYVQGLQFSSQDSIFDWLERLQGMEMMWVIEESQIESDIYVTILVVL